ncbi:MAG: AAA family ATPase [Acidobacteria bacterium]|nr:AAA family ATPase [Acidobacteriota bacterium]
MADLGRPGIAVVPGGAPVSDMEPTIKQLVLKRFRSIPSERMTFDNPTIFVGRNGSGKSNLVSVFSFLAEAMASPLQAVFDKAGGISAVRNRTSGRSYPPNLGLRVDFGRMNGRAASGFYAFEVRALPNYGFSVVREQCSVGGERRARSWFDRVGTKFMSNVNGMKPALDPASLSLPLVGGEAKFAPVLRTLAAMRVYSIEPGKLSEMQEPDSGTSLKPDGSNVTSVLKEIERQSDTDFQRISAILATIVPNTTRVQVKKHGKNLSLEFTQEWGVKKRLKFEGFSMSDGTLRAIGLLAAVFQRPVPSLIAVEEPEATIHPSALESVLDLLHHASRHMQVVVTTHSPELLDAKWITDRHLRIVEWTEGATRVAPVSEVTRKALRDHLMGAGELLRSNALDPAPLFDDQAKLMQSDFFEELA